MGRAARLSLLLVAVASLWPSAVIAAQQGAPRAAVDSILAELARTGPGTPIVGASRCRSYPGTLGRLCSGLLDLKRIERDPKPGLAFDTEMALRRVIGEEPEWATGWYALAMARLQLPRAGVLAREGPLQPLGVTSEAGASHALVRALEIEPTFLLAAEALALAPFPREGPSQMGDRREMLRRLRHQLPLSPAARLGVALVEREAGDNDTAVVMLREALAAGADSGSVHLELARVLHRLNRSAEGRTALVAGASLATSQTAKGRYREELRWVASPEELASWDATPTEQRADWLAAFWVDRDVRDGRASGERLVEHYVRYEEAMSHFRVVIPQKGRQKFRSVSMAGDTRSIALENASIEDAERTRTATSEYAATLGADVPFREFGIEQELLDDRGVIWIRHGEPTERTYTSGGTAMEGWRWDRAPEPDLVLFFAEADFDGTSGASVLVTTPAASGGLVINQLCGNAQGMCDELLRFSQPEGVMNAGGGAGRRRIGASGQAANPAAQANIINDARDVGRQQIIRGVTTDDYRPTFEEPLKPVVQIYGLDRSGGGAPRLLVAVALPGERLHGTQPPAAGGRTVYPVRFAVMATVKGRPERFDLDTIRQFAVREPLAKGQFLTATVELPVPSGTYAATVVVEQGAGIGGLSRLPAVATPVAGRFSISSLVLGRSGSGVTWSSGSQAVPLNPLNAYPKGGEAELYYQLAGLEPGAEYQTRIEFFEAQKTAEAAALAVTSTDRAAAPWVEVQRTIGLRQLKEGGYRVRITVSREGQSVTETAFLAVLKE
jgi:hypothetical protein